MQSSIKRLPYLNLPGISPWRTKLDTQQNQEKPILLKTNVKNVRNVFSRNLQYVSQNSSRCETRRSVYKHPQFHCQRMILGPIFCSNLGTNRKQTMLVMKQNKAIQIEKPPIQNALCVRMFRSQDKNDNNNDITNSRQCRIKQRKIQFKIDYNDKNHQNFSKKVRII